MLRYLYVLCKGDRTSLAQDTLECRVGESTVMRGDRGVNSVSRPPDEETTRTVLSSCATGVLWGPKFKLLPILFWRFLIILILYNQSPILLIKAPILHPSSIPYRNPYKEPLKGAPGPPTFCLGEVRGRHRGSRQPPWASTSER